MRSSDADARKDVVLVVGYDGTEPAHRALAAAAEMLEDGTGRLEVVYVAHEPSVVAFSPQALASVREGLDAETDQLSQQVDAVLSPLDVKWHFQRRDGEIAVELVAAGEEQLGSGGPGTHVVLVVGGTAGKIDRYLNSTPAKVIRKDRFEVLVVP
jgi:nucleotide-binding universal stress UspA family protein